MDYSGSEWSSGCESGWTSYFDESTHSPNQLQKGKSKKSAHENHKVGRNSIRYHNGGKHEEDEEEEDLSMVSDASSGPPTHSQDFYYYQDCGFDPFPNGSHYSPSPNKSDSKNKKKKQNGVDQQRGKQQQHSYLDDTATSPAFDHQFSHKFSSADQFQGNFVFSNQFGTFWQSSHPKHPDSAEPSQMRGKRWK